MFIQLHAYYYDTHCHGYIIRPLVLNIDEISDFHDTNEVDRGYIDAVKISLKNGSTYNVKETCKEIMEKIIK